MGILSGNPQEEPMHYGEVFGVWSYYLAKKSIVAGYQTLANHTGDRDLKALLEDIIRTAQKESEQVETVLKANGIALPPCPPERSSADLNSIPAGARFNDAEIALMLSKDIAVGLVSCSQVIGMSIREDIGLMFGQFHATKMQFGARILRLNKDKGWLIPPPLHIQRPEAVHV